MAAEEVQKQGDKLVWGRNPEARLSARAHKMSKSRGNVINPDDVVHCYGADSLRLYEMFLGPLQDTKVSLHGAALSCQFHGMRVFSWYFLDRRASLHGQNASNSPACCCTLLECPF